MSKTPLKQERACPRQSDKRTDPAARVADLRFSRLPREQLWDSLKLVRGVSADTARVSLEFCFAAARICWLCGEDGIGRYWYSVLAAKREQGAADPDCLYECAALCEPGIGTADLLARLEALHRASAGRPVLMERVSVTGNRPSVLRGARDLSDWGRNEFEMRCALRPLLSLFGEAGIGLVEAAVAELYYERDDLNAASLEAVRALKTENPEVAFAGLAVLARVSCLDAQSIGARKILEDMTGMLVQKGAYALRRSLAALQMRFDLQDGRMNPVSDWLYACDLNELERCCVSDAYELLAKGRAYLGLGRCRDAVLLFEGLRRTLEEERRTLDLTECLIGSAIACLALDNEELALEKIGRALAAGSPFGYIRVFADFGACAVDVLRLWRARREQAEPALAKFAQTAQTAAEKFAQAFPAMLAGPR